MKMTDDEKEKVFILVFDLCDICLRFLNFLEEGTADEFIYFTLTAEQLGFVEIGTKLFKKTSELKEKFGIKLG